MKTYQILVTATLVILLGCEKPVEQGETEQIKTELSNSEVEDAIIALERQALDNWANGSVEGYTVNFAEDVTYSDDIMAHTGITGLDKVRVYARKLDSMQVISKHNYDIVNPQVKVLDKAAVLNLVYHPYKPDGSDGTKWRASIVYRQKGDSWEVINADWTMLKQQ